MLLSNQYTLVNLNPHGLLYQPILRRILILAGYLIYFLRHTKRSVFSAILSFIVAIDSNDRTSDMGDSFSPSLSSLSLSSDEPFTNSQDSGARNILSDDEVETPRWLQDVS